MIASDFIEHRHKFVLVLDVDFVLFNFLATVVSWCVPFNYDITVAFKGDEHVGGWVGFRGGILSKRI